MHLDITDNTSLAEIQEIFADFYPYLQIRFYKTAHRKYEASDKVNEIDPNTLIRDIKDTHVSGVLEMQPSYKISAIEKEFQHRFGLSVQILRKEKGEWEQTTGMDDFTLKELNEIGRNSSDDFIIEDYEEGFEENEPGPDKLY